MSKWNIAAKSQEEQDKVALIWQPVVSPIKSV
ncbi:Uncharacterised protein [Klebsiella oxytoca]|uniref:Uncharacterized protein n=1 Tax=Klebsiella oxytoca TaxID=571 RepID=A0A6N3GFL9_KLEOX